MKGAYKTWLNQDVTYIITDEERKAFKSLSNDEERDAFIENFWLRRNPNPGFARERVPRGALPAHRLCQRALCGRQARLEDRPRPHLYRLRRSRLIDAHPSGGSYQRPMEEGGGETSTFPFEIWHYRYLEGIGENIDLEFVDTCQCGDYHFTIDRSEKDALLHVPGAGLTQYEEMGHKAKKPTASRAAAWRSLGTGPMGAATAGQGIRPHRAGRQDLCPAADQVQGPGRLHLRAQAAHRPGVPLRCAHRLCQGDRQHGYWCRSPCR